MAIQYTPKQALPVPDHNEYLKDLPGELLNMADAIENKLVQVYSDQTALGNAITSATAGMFAWVTADKVLQVFDGTAWQRVYPPSPMIYSGSATPASTLGTTGDIYIQS